MSFILQALRKQAVNQDQSFLTDKAEAQYAINNEKEHSFIGWGILLVLAIFVALAMGFWFGQQQLRVKTAVNVSKDNTEHVISGETSTPIELSVSKPQQQMAIPKQQDLPIKSMAKHIQISAEHYFDEPSAYQNNKNKPALAADPAVSKKLSSTDSNNSDTNKGNDIVLNPDHGVSDELFARFQSAIDATSVNNSKPLNNQGNNSHETSKAAQNSVTQSTEIESIADLPNDIQQALPKMVFTMHMYASDGNGWVRVNGQDLYEGDKISGKVVIVEIKPQRILLSYKKYYFMMPALSSW